jgi:hypothetical protein
MDAAAPTPPTPPPDPDLRDARVVAELFDQAAQANLQSPLRLGSVIGLPDRGSLLITGDLHDHSPNLQRILKLAALDHGPDRYLVLHEVVHGPHLVNGCDLSVRTLAKIASLILRFPGQVHLMLANHELAQLGGEGILKAGVSVVESFDRGIAFIYGDGATLVNEALQRFIRSLTLAVRCANGVFCCHSLPSPRHLKGFDTSVIRRVPTDMDLAPAGHAYNMVWGRKHTQELADALGGVWDVRVFVMGHQPAEMGFYTEGDSMLVLASDHEHGVALPIDLSHTYGRDDLVDRIVPLASVQM